MKKSWTLAQKMSLFALLIVTAVIIANMTFETLTQYRLATEQADQKILILAQSTAFNLAAPSMFGDAEAANEVLSALSVDPTIISAHLLNMKKERMAKYQRVADTQPNDLKHISVLVNWQDTPVGELTLDIDINPLKERLYRQIGFALISTLVAVLVAGLLVHWMSYTLTKPLRHLSDVARRVGRQGNYHLRAEPNLSRDEVGQLTANFNGMLEHIEEQAHSLREQQAILLASEQRLLLANVSAGLAVWDLDLHVDSMEWDDKMFELYGITRAASSNNLETWLSSFHPNDKEQAISEYQAALQGVKEFDTVFRIICPDGRVKYIKANAIVIRDADGDAQRMLGVNADVTEGKKAEEEIQRLAFFDQLTELPNRRLLLDRFKHALIASGRRNKHGALLFIDLDNFKNLNDTLGHDMGDMLLQLITQRLNICIRESDTVARLGGDEFVVLLSDLSNQALEAAANTKVICENILSAIDQPCQLGRQTYRCTASIGVALFKGPEQPVDELMKQGDIAMYQAKKAGRNTVRFFDQRMQKDILDRVLLESELYKALECEQFELHYQIQIDDLHRPLGAEALIRWRHPERGLVPPMQFIPLAEETGLILPIGLWVLQSACAQLKAWQVEPSTRDLVLSINVSAKQFHQTDFVAQVQAALDYHAINAELLRLELTESLLQENIEETIGIMMALSKIGVSFSLDDFGTGYSSLQYLKRLPLDELKIDQSFVRDITSDSSDKAIVSTIIAMAEILGLSVIAEGVETAEQRQFLVDEGCTRFQGYLFGKPMAIGQFNENIMK